MFDINRQLITDTRVGDGTSPLHLQIVNDIYSDSVTITFESQTTGPQTCVINTAFDIRNSPQGYAIVTLNDDGAVYYEKFVVDTDCFQYPTGAPS